MSSAFESLGKFFNRVKTIGFWQRIFGWKSFRVLSYEAYDEYSKISDSIERLNQKLEGQRVQIDSLERTNELNLSKLESEKTNILKLEERIRKLEDDLQRITQERNNLAAAKAKFEESEQNRAEQYQSNVSQVNALRESLESDRKILHDDRVREKEAAFEKMKQTWREHEELVESTIRSICSRYTIDYIDKVPFRGKPDNAIMIAGEYIIFDAKSPASDDLDNFPVYLKAQTEQLSKYTKQEGVKKDIFLVIPSNTTAVAGQFVYNMGDYNVYVLTLDALEPVMLSLKKIEDYEFADQLSPEERDNICRVIGKFAHTAKRRIQIDYFFSYQFLEILGKVKSDLPNEFYDIIAEFEKAEKLNPPQEKRAKQILTDELIAESEKLYIEAEAKLKSSGENRK